MTQTATSSTGTTSISAMELRRELGRFLDRVSYRGESFLIERAGEPKAVLVPIRDYQEMKRIKQAAKEQFFTMTKELRQAFRDVNPKKIEKEVKKAIKQVRVAKKTYAS